MQRQNPLAYTLFAEAAMSVATSPTVRSILSENVDMPADDVIAKAKALGVKAEDKAIRSAVHTVRSDMKKSGAKPKAAPAVAQETKAPASREVTHATPVVAAPVAVSDTANTGTGDIKRGLESIQAVNKVASIVGGAERVRLIVQTIESCGGTQLFLEQLAFIEELKKSTGQSIG